MILPRLRSVDLLTNDQNAVSLTLVFLNWLDQLRRSNNIHTGYGTTAKRPTLELEIGAMYFDTTLNKPIWVKTISPVVWVDATGLTV